MPSQNYTCSTSCGCDPKKDCKPKPCPKLAPPCPVDICFFEDENNDYLPTVKITNNTAFCLAPGLRISIGPLEAGVCIFPANPEQAKLVGYVKRTSCCKNEAESFDAVFELLCAIEAGECEKVAFDSDVLENNTLEACIEPFNPFKARATCKTFSSGQMHAFRMGGAKPSGPMRTAGTTPCDQFCSNKLVITN